MVTLGTKLTRRGRRSVEDCVVRLRPIIVEVGRRVGGRVLRLHVADDRPRGDLTPLYLREPTDARGTFQEGGWTRGAAVWAMGAGRGGKAPTARPPALGRRGRPTDRDWWLSQKGRMMADLVDQ